MGWFPELDYQSPTQHYGCWIHSTWVEGVMSLRGEGSPNMNKRMSRGIFWPVTLSMQSCTANQNSFILGHSKKTCINVPWFKHFQHLESVLRFALYSLEGVQYNLFRILNWINLVRMLRDICFELRSMLAHSCSENVVCISFSQTAFNALVVAY